MALDNNQIVNSNTDNDEISLKDLVNSIKYWFNFLLKRWKYIFLFAFLGFVIGFLYAYTSKVKYNATLSYVLEDDKGATGGSGGGLSSIVSQFGIDLGGSANGAFAASNIGELIKSRSIVESTLLRRININGKNTTIADYYIEEFKLNESWKKSANLNAINFIAKKERKDFSRLEDSILNEFYKDLTNKEKLIISQVDKKVSITNLQVISTSEKFSKLFCESLAQEVTDYYIKTKTQKGKINVDILQKQVDSVRYELSRALNGVATATDNVFYANPSLMIKQAPIKNKMVDVEANKAILTQLVIQLEMAQVSLRKETPLIQILDKPIFPLERIKIGKAKSAVIGGTVFAFLTIISLIAGSLYRKMMA
jgi:hypothetical protein